MKWRVSFLGASLATLILAVPTSIRLAVAELLPDDAEQMLGTTGTRGLPLGQPTLPELRTSTSVVSGVTHTVIVRGKQSENNFYIVDVAFQSTLEAAQAVAKSLNAKGYQPRIKTIFRQVRNNDLKRGPLGYLIRVGYFDSETKAINLQERLVAAGYSGSRVVYSGEDGGKTTGPWVVNVLEVNPALFKGTLAPKLATRFVPGTELLTSIATRTKALAAVNGGYFVIGTADGTPGDLAGISVINGVLVSEAVNGRTSLVLPYRSGKEARIAALTSQQTVTTTNGITRKIDGLNRKPGLIRGCGGVGGDTPTQEPKHDFTCTDASELIQFTPAFGLRSEPGEGTEAVLNRSNQVIKLSNQCGGQIPSNGSVLCGTGNAAKWLQTYAQLNTKIDIQARVLANGQALPTNQALGVINGGPRLLRNGAVEIAVAAEGFNWQENPEFYYRFGVRRNPRTLAGITANGNLLFVTVDGRQPGWSVGASFKESAQIMRSLGAVDAFNLDGGGSTTMTIGERLVNRPSDATGERPIGDAIVIQP
jgi:hypothetical protein